MKHLKLTIILLVALLLPTVTVQAASQTISGASYYTSTTGDSRGMVKMGNTNGRWEMFIRSAMDSYMKGSRGSGINLYGNADWKHPGELVFMTGEDDKGDARLIIRQDGRVQVGSGNIWSRRLHTGQFQITTRGSRPTLYLERSSRKFGTVALPFGETFSRGVYKDGKYYERFMQTSYGHLQIKTVYTNPESHMFRMYSSYTKKNNLVFYVKANGDVITRGRVIMVEQDGTQTDLLEVIDWLIDRVNRLEP